MQPGEVENALNTCKTVADMIDLAAKELEEIRALATDESYFKDEIIDSETKIVRLVAKQMSVKRKLFRCRSLSIPADIRDYPSLTQFFRVLNFSPLVAERCKQTRQTNELVSASGRASLRFAEEEDGLTLELLMNTCESEVHDRFVSQFGDILSCEQIHKMLIALDCLRTAMQFIDSVSGQSPFRLHWSYRDVSPCAACSSSRSINYDDEYLISGSGSGSASSCLQRFELDVNKQQKVSRDMRNSFGALSNGDSCQSVATNSGNVPAGEPTKQSPPASPRPLPQLAVTAPSAAASRFKNALLNLNTGFPLIKSKSQESQLGSRVQPLFSSANVGEKSPQAGYVTSRTGKRKPMNLKLSGSHETLNSGNLSRNLACEDECDGEFERAADDSCSRAEADARVPHSAAPFVHHQHGAFLRFNSTTTSRLSQDDAVSISSGLSLSLQVPRSPASYHTTHSSHRFESMKRTFAGSCDVCRKRLLLSKARICTVCRFKCHRDCAPKAQLTTSCPGRPGESDSSSVASSPRRVCKGQQLPLDVRNPASASKASTVTSTAQPARRPASTSTLMSASASAATVCQWQVEDQAVLALPGSSTASSTQSTAPSSPNADCSSMRHPTTSSSSAANLSGASASALPSPFLGGGIFQFPPPTELGVKSSVIISPAGVSIPAVTVTDAQSPPAAADVSSKLLTAAVAAQRLQVDDQTAMSVTAASIEKDRSLIDSGWGTDIDRLTPMRADSVDFDLPDDGPTYAADGMLLSPGGEAQTSLSRTVSISATLKEWDIPFESLQRKQLIGVGRFATVHRGQWHGDCAVKLFSMTNADADADADGQADAQLQLQTFKLEVAVLKKTRHENLVLFMGACMKPPNLAIVTSLCRGPEHTLFHKIHILKDKLPLNRATLIASQITQGMSYLHAKRVLHKDLRTKNIFIEGAKIVISDYGLFNVTRFCAGRTKLLSSSCICYLAPEIVRSIAVCEGALRFLPPANLADSDSSDGDRSQNQSAADSDYDPFTTQSDVFAFGTVWYELLASDWPFREQTAESVLWRMATGAKPEISELQCNKESKALFLECWSHDAARRPPFTAIYKALDRIPKKGLARAPSHPVTRSAEAFY